MNLIGGVDMLKDSGEEAWRKVLTQSMERQAGFGVKSQGSLI